MSSERSPRMGAPALLPAPPRRSLDLLLPPVLGVSATHGALRDWRGTVARGGAFGAWALGSTLHLEGALLGSPAPPLGSGQSLVAVPSLRLSLWGAQGPGCASIPTQTARRQGEQGAKEGGWVRRPCSTGREQGRRLQMQLRLPHLLPAQAGPTLAAGGGPHWAPSSVGSRRSKRRL